MLNIVILGHHIFLRKSWSSMVSALLYQYINASSILSCSNVCIDTYRNSLVAWRKSPPKITFTLENKLWIHKNDFNCCMRYLHLYRVRQNQSSPNQASFTNIMRHLFAIDSSHLIHRTPFSFYPLHIQRYHPSTRYLHNYLPDNRRSHRSRPLARRFLRLRSVSSSRCFPLRTSSQNPCLLSSGPVQRPRGQRYL